MILGERIRKLREAKNLPQGDIEKRTDLTRSYISRLEKGHTVPSLETLERIAAAVEVPLYQVVYEGHDLPGETMESGAGDEATQAIALLRRVRRMRERKSEAPGDARLAFRTLAPDAAPWEHSPRFLPLGSHGGPHAIAAYTAALPSTS